METALESVPPPGGRPPILGKALFVAALSAALFLVAGKATDPLDGAPASWRIDRAMEEVFRGEGLDRGALRAQAAKGEPAEVQAEVPAGASFARMNVDLTRAVEDAGGHVLDALEKGDPERPSGLEMKLGVDRRVTHTLELRREEPAAPAAPGPRIAVVFDDLGYTTSGLVRDLLDMPAEITFAVLPEAPVAVELARAATARGHEVLLHLPMEPVDMRHHDPGRDALLADLDLDENLRRLRRQLDGFTGWIGVSNHMGSRFTASSDLMAPVLQEIRRHGSGLFFLDSSTTPYSMVGTAARSTGMPYLANNLFLDGGDEGSDLPAVRTDRVAAIALRRGHAVAIGHVKPATVEAVRTAIDRWRAQGIRIVHLSELVSH